MLQSGHGAKGHRHMAEREIVIPLTELKKVEVFCTACGSGAVFAFSKDIVHTSEQRFDDKGPAQSCPSCHTHFGSSIIAALGKWYQLVSFAQSSPKFVLKFHVPQSSAEPEKVSTQSPTTVIS